MAALRRSIAAYPDGVMLESAAGPGSGGRFSVFATHAIRTVAAIEDDPFARDPFRGIPAVPASASASASGPVDRSCEPSFFRGGWIGYLAYEAGGFIDPSAARPRSTPHPLPLSFWRLYDTALVHDFRDDSWMALAADLPRQISRCDRPPASQRLDAIERFVADLGDATTAPRDDRPGATGVDPGAWNMSRAAYIARVEQALDYIRAGDIFQVNLARQFRMPTTQTPGELYDRLCRTNPADYAVFMRIPTGSSRRRGGGAILSSSPELFLSVEGRKVTTRPIKGTRPRVGDPAIDAVARRELAASAKDRAELNMIIDLERNDLGRVCEYGSVRVECDGRIESHPTVYHRTATIVGTLRENTTPADLLRATFPGGSITGAPKVRAMQIINELEPQPRGPYCGAIGYIGLDGDLRLNLAIRTMWTHDRFVILSAGGGIVADSNAADEYDETAAKARGMLAALGIEESRLDRALVATAGRG